MLRSGAVPSGIPPHPTLAFLVLVSIVAGGCAARTLNADQLERRLGRQLSERLGCLRDRGRPVRTASRSRRERRFACTARAPGEDVGLRIVITQLDDDGNVTWEIAGTAG